MTATATTTGDFGHPRKGFVSGSVIHDGDAHDELSAATRAYQEVLAKAHAHALLDASGIVQARHRLKALRRAGTAPRGSAEPDRGDEDQSRTLVAIRLETERLQKEISRVEIRKGETRPVGESRPTDTSPEGAADEKSARRNAAAALQGARKSLSRLRDEFEFAGLLTGEMEHRIGEALRTSLGQKRPSAAALWEAVRQCGILTAELSLLVPVPDPGAASEPETQKKTKRRRRPRTARKNTLQSVLPAKGPLPPAAVPVSYTERVRKVDLAQFADRPEILAELGARMQIITLMNAQHSAASALETAGLQVEPRTVRAAQRWYRQWCAQGHALDSRWLRSADETALTPEVKRLILRTWHGRRKASLAEVCRQVNKAVTADQQEAESQGRECTQRKIEYITLYKFIQRLPAEVKQVRNEGIEAWDKNTRMVVEYDPAEYANHIWMIDHARCDIHVRVEVKPGVWEPMDVWITVIIDVYSRVIMGWFLSLRSPDAWTTALVFRQAAILKDDPAWPVSGVPGVLVPDHGRDFMGHQVAGMLRSLPKYVSLEPTPPYYPNMKAEIERWFLTLKFRLAGMAGFMEAEGSSLASARLRVMRLLTFAQLKEEVRLFVNEYNSSPHKGIQGQIPLDVWQRTVRLFKVDAEEMNILMLQSDVRRVQKKGIQFTHAGRGGWYVDQQLQLYMGQDVRLRYNPEDMDTLLVYHADTGEYLCEVGLFGTTGHTRDDVVGWRKGFRQSLKERSVAYLKEVFEDDRRSARAQDERLARARAAVAQEPRTVPDPITLATEDRSRRKSKLLDLFKSHDRRETVDLSPEP